MKAALQLARQTSPTGSRNLLTRDESYAAFLQQTVLPAPVNGGHCYRIDRNLDRQARQQISVELGHNRFDVVSAYIGGRA